MRAEKRKRTAAARTSSSRSRVARLEKVSGPDKGICSGQQTDLSERTILLPHRVEVCPGPPAFFLKFGTGDLFRE